MAPDPTLRSPSRHRASRHSLARRERHDLCDLALVLGEDAPTLCEGWDAKDLVVHLLVRESRPLGAAGLVVGPLSGLTDRSMARMRSRDFGVLVERLRDPGFTPYAVPLLEKVLNTLEFFVHHEDLRRAQPGWTRRDLAPADTDLLWSMVRGLGRMTIRSAGVPVVVRRADRPDSPVTLRAGTDAVTVTAPVTELVLFLFGRDQVDALELDGPAERVSALREAPLGL